MDTKVIGIIGNHGAGKSSLAARLARDLGGQQMSFADPIRDRLAQVLPYRPDKTKRHPYEREALVLVGETWRQEDPEIFVRALQERLEPGITIIDDVYHHNERAICDICLYIRHIGYQPPTGYLPVSVRETLEMLEEAERAGAAGYHAIREPQELDQRYPEILAWVRGQLFQSIRRHDSI